MSKNDGRLSAVFENHNSGSETARIRANDFVKVAGHSAVGLKPDRAFVAQFLEQASGVTIDERQRAALQKTVAGLPEQTSVEDLFVALEKEEPLAIFSAALRQQLNGSAP
ncbi:MULTISPECIES: hypothetical protein [Pseudomonas]|uniref:hypothetical protein n=1 Tax=Pseudomonas TaxID=286 RepID=UPI00070AB55C|nr:MULTISPECIES: hypothetical protein [Pseudomonas]KQW19773.1 hypothetical protein ASC85_07950 [Pseudomonas sp. Root401]WHS57352.1 hypothetical protein QLH64_30510 [Pseudomonas brassicacearum]